MTKRVSRNNRPLKMSFTDVKKANWCSEVLRELYVELPPEANKPQDIVWRLQRAMYGTRDGMGTRVGANAERSWVRVWCEQPSVATLRGTERIHGGARDDFITLGDDDAIGEVEHVMSSHYTMKVRAILGATRDDAKEVRILNRYVLQLRRRKVLD